MRLSFNTEHLGQVRTHAKPAPERAGCFLHHAVGTQGGDVADIVRQLMEHGLGYNYLIKGDVVYPLAPWDWPVSHASSFNRSHVGIAIAYQGPSTRPRGIPGEQGPGPTDLYHPPFDPVSISTARDLVAWLRQKGVGPDLRVHWQENPRKADPWPLVPADFEPGE